MQALRRHQLVWLDEYAWFRVLACAPPANEEPADPARPAQDGPALDCLAHWAQQRWPLVVTRQPDPACHARPAGTLAAGTLALGLAAPARWGRRPLTLAATLRDVAATGAFPPAAALRAELPAAVRPGWLRLCNGLDRLGLPGRVYGSYGWQFLTGMDYVHAGSDIDLVVDVETPAQADQAVEQLLATDTATLRLDGELAFAHGGAVAWREWLQFRTGAVTQVLVKRLHGAALEDPRSWAGRA